MDHHYTLTLISLVLKTIKRLLRKKVLKSAALIYCCCTTSPPRGNVCIDYSNLHFFIHAMFDR